MQKMSQSGARLILDPKGTRLAPQHFSARIHILFRQTWLNLTLAKPESFNDSFPVVSSTTRVFLDVDP